MAGNQVFAMRGKLALDDVQVGAANATGPHLKKYVPGFQFGTTDLLNVQWSFHNGTRVKQNCGFHDTSL
jgi:hypothetical protein